ncbi:M4 family metallopeptidase [Sinimarinibacterium sp. CAU 1509]|uniref:M4 family metallopeptidase n=1 Tax=Sinimarinibacterium sp. CAU 1509 TaxID=2562283 RepID=UPI00146E4E33|nr:M4 family metallopeptidase [Sinimarinibacterium sp. CAU 1509]
MLFETTRSRAIALRLIGAALTMSATTAPALPAASSGSIEQLLQQLRDNTAGAIQQTRITADDYVAISATGSLPMLADDTAATPLQRAQFFLSVYGSVAGITDPLTQLSPRRTSTDAAGFQHVHLDQTYRGLPVFGARMVVHLGPGGVTGVNGVFINGLDGLSIEPAMRIADLHQRALAAGRKAHPQATLSLESGRLMIYRSGLLKGLHGRNFLAYEAVVAGAPGEAVRERVILDANTGAVLNRINEIHSLLNREIHTPTLDAPPLLTEGSALAPADPPFSGDVTGSTRSANLPTDNLYIFAGGTYALYKNLFGREGYDDGAMPPEEQVQRSVYLINENCPNAYWDGTSTNYCPGFDADDVVSHEWSHAYTEYTHGLVYQYQSGALNESYSDIFGETYDLVNGIEGPLGVTLTEGEYYENGGSRWVLGEDLSETAAALLLRDMWDPDNFSVHVPIVGIPAVTFAPSPGSVITSQNYYCGTGDGGGVHTNSGVPNHAYAMLVDGKEFNGVTIPAIGMIKAAQIYFHAETHYQTPTTNFAQHADALEQSCHDLIGAPLNDVFGEVSDQVITATDCDAVHAAMVAVEMRESPVEKCGYLPVLAPEDETPALCPSGQAPEPSFSETWESGSVPATWTLGKNLTGDTEPAVFRFEVTADLPAPHSGKAAFAVDDTGGTCAAGGDISGSYWMDSPVIDVAIADSFLTFTHFMQSEQGYDGGNLKYSLNGSDFSVVPDAAFTHNGHNGEFEAAAPAGQNTNPLASEAAWTGSDQGEATGSWGRTVVSLADLGANAGDTVQFRWEFGNDGCGGNLGWYVDDTAVFSCKAGGSGLPTSGGGDGGGNGGGDTDNGDQGRFGGALSLWLLLPLLGIGTLRRRTWRH